MFTNNNNSLFGSQFSTSNPFMNQPQSISQIDQNIANVYSQLEALKNPQQNQQRQNTVFTDIFNEMKSMSDDEKAYIFSTKEYIAANAKYQEEFSAFLINKFSGEFLQNHQRTMEELLSVIKSKKEQYKNKFADDVAEIRERNKDLADKNAALAKNNQILQEELKKIQMKLGYNNL